MVSLALLLVLGACVLFRWMFPTASRILGWFVLIVFVPLASYLMYWGVTTGEAYAGLGAIIAAIALGIGGLTYGSALVWGNRGINAGLPTDLD